MKEKNKRILFITFFIVVAALMRLIPHPPNFVPLTAIAIFAGIKFKNIKLAYIIPISIMLISDLFILRILNFNSKYFLGFSIDLLS